MTKREIIRLAALLALPFVATFVAGTAISIIGIWVGWLVGIPMRGSAGLYFVVQVATIAGLIIGILGTAHGFDQEVWREKR